MVLSQQEIDVGGYPMVVRRHALAHSSASAYRHCRGSMYLRYGTLPEVPAAWQFGLGPLAAGRAA
jgi:hypothetical protein